MSNWPELSSLEVLVAVAEHGSLSAAARELHMEQPNVSRSISRLERRLNLALLRRSPTGSRLTPEGSLFVEWAREVLGSANSLMRNAQALRINHTSELKISASQTIAEYMLPKWLASFRAAAPNTQVSLRVRNTADVLHELHLGECDLGFIEGPVSKDSTHSAMVGEDQLVLVVASLHPWASKFSVQPQEIMDSCLITREPGSGTRQVLDDALKDPVIPHIALESNAAVRVALLSGAGPAVLSRSAVSEAVATGKLVEIPIEGVHLQRQLRAVWTGPRQLTGPAAKLASIAIASPHGIH